MSKYMYRIFHNMNKKELIDFENKIKKLWEAGRIPYYVHLSGGNEDQLIEIFKEIKPGDYIFSSHRSHYHYLLAGGSAKKLEEKILAGKSMHIIDPEINFIASAILSGCAGIAAGVAMALKTEGSKNRVYCFIGDGAEDEGHFYEAVRYIEGWGLPCTFIIEDNDRSVETPKKERYGSFEMNWPKCVKRYCYTPTYPHAGTGAWVDFSGNKIGSTM